MRRRRADGVGNKLAIAAAIVVVASVAVPAGSFTTGAVDRNSTIDVATDENGIFGLQVSETVTIGGTGPLVGMSNNVNHDVAVTIRLAPSSADTGDLLVDGVDQGDSATFTLSPGANETVDLQATSDCDLAGKSIQFDVDGDASTFDGFAPRNSKLIEPSAIRTEVAYRQAADGTLATVNKSGAIADTGITTDGFGAPSADFDCDGRMEVAYVSGGDITLFDRTGQSQSLVTSDAKTDVRLGVGDVDGDSKPAVLYANASDNDHLYRAELGETPVKVAPVAVHSVTNPADFNGDGSADIVFTDSAGNLKYYNGTVHDVGVDVNCGRCLGDPADFDGSGTLRVPYLQPPGSALQLVDSDGNIESAWDGSGGPQGTLGSFDWDDDGTSEIIIVDKHDDRLYYVETSGKQTAITDENGDRIAGDSKGAA